MELSNETLLLNRSMINRDMSDFMRDLPIVKSDELIDIDRINFGNDETWLFAPKSSSTTVNLQDWLHEDVKTDLEKAKLKIIDTRTFTRPKRKSNRPSIELYNDTFNSIKSNDSIQFKNGADILMKCLNNDNGGQLEAPKFDLTQPVTSDPFDKILLSSTGLDSFINMSPPSLVNSMCSSTFSTIMMDSINQKDDLLQMKISNYSDQSLLQDIEQPMFQSFTNSCSSLCSDMQDSFLKKTLSTFNGTLKLQSSREDLYKSLNSTICKDDSSKESLASTKDLLNETVIVVDGKGSNENIDPNITITTQNNTFTKTNRLDGTFNKPHQDKLNNTYQKIPTNLVQRFLKQNDMNTTYTETNKHDGTFIKERINDLGQDNSNTILDNSQRNESQKQRGSFTIVNGHSGKINENVDLSTKVSKECDEIKDMPFSPGSNDSLDRISSISNGSCKMLNMSEVDALIEMQERCLLEASTPIVPKTQAAFQYSKSDSFDDSSTKTCSKSESDLSSADEYMTVGSGFSNNSSTQSLSKDPIRIDKQIKGYNNEAIVAAKPRNIFNTNTNGTTREIDKKLNLTSLPIKLKGSMSNMKVLDSKLKGSYTNLKPLGTNLPQIPSLKTHLAKSNQNIHNAVKIAPVPVVSSDTVLKSKLKAPSKPQIGVSGLPRPTTGIPRPSSRIPTPNYGRPMSMKPYSTNKPNHF